MLLISVLGLRLYSNWFKMWGFARLPDLLWWGSNPCNGPSNTLIGAFYCLSGPASQCRVGQDHGWIYRVRRSVSQCQQQRGRPSGHDGRFVTWSQWQKWPGIGNIALSTVRTTKDQSAFHTCKCTTAESHAARKTACSSAFTKQVWAVLLSDDQLHICIQEQRMCGEASIKL